MQNAPPEHSAILYTCIKLPPVFKTFMLSISEWPLKTGLTVLHLGISLLHLKVSLKSQNMSWKTNKLILEVSDQGRQGFWPGLTQSRLYNHRRWLEAVNFRFRKKRDCTIYLVKTKTLISASVFRICKKPVFWCGSYWNWYTSYEKFI